jgi:hypothetical protein
VTSVDTIGRTALGAVAMFVALALALFVAGCGDAPADRDDCVPGACDHGACVDGVNAFTCACDPGWEGPRCEHAIDECAPNPCQNGGTCSDGVADFTCACPSGFAGKTCAIDVDDCTPNPCLHGGVCVDGVNGFTCRCAPGFDGPTCELDVDECTPNPCLHGGVCTDGANDFTCACPTGYGGKRCELVVVSAPTNLSAASLTGRPCADGFSSSVIALDAATARLEPAPPSGCLAAGDEILLINLRGAGAQIGNVGNWELLTVASVTGDTVAFAAPKTRFYGDDGGDANIGVGDGQQRVVVQRVPRVENLMVTARLEAAAWDGLRGGVLALRVSGDAMLAQPIDMSGKGYRGGATNPTFNATGFAGESLGGEGAQRDAANLGGGGGGLGDGNACGNNGFSGGGGGHATAGGAGSPTKGCGGAGGAAYGDGQLTRLHLGSGGGSGGMDNAADNPPGAAGGAGGGIVLLLVGGSVTGKVAARGAPGVGDPIGFECPELDPSTTSCWDFSGAGGGGAGGSVLIQAASYAGTVDVSGGRGGNANNYFVTDGGDGASGRARTP